jgi:hypothetical protein
MGIAFSKLDEEVNTAIRRAAVYDDMLDWPVGLLPDALDRVCQKPCLVEARRDDRDKRLAIGREVARLLL